MPSGKNHIALLVAWAIRNEITSERRLLDRMAAQWEADVAAGRHPDNEGGVHDSRSTPFSRRIWDGSPECMQASTTLEAERARMRARTPTAPYPCECAGCREWRLIAGVTPFDGFQFRRINRAGSTHWWDLHIMYVCNGLTEWVYAEGRKLRAEQLAATFDVDPSDVEPADYTKWAPETAALFASLLIS